MRHRYYVLAGHNVVPTSFEGWCQWSRFYWDDTTIRQVAFTHTEDIEVSTVFLGIDHNFGAIFDNDDEAPPLVFETMVFHKLDKPRKLSNDQEIVWDGNECIRSATWEEAEETHKMMVKKVISRQYKEAGNV